MPPTTWQELALAALNRSLVPVPSERNELDWKVALSDKSDRLAEHLSAFGNLDGGGFIAFGIDNDGKPAPLDQQQMDQVIQRMVQIARQGVEPPLELDHTVVEHRGGAVLILRIPEHQSGPVHIKGKDIFHSFTRASGHTVKMSRQEVARAISRSAGDLFEGRPAIHDQSDEQVLDLIDHDSYFRLQKERAPTSHKAILQRLETDAIIESAQRGWIITNLGALLFARDIGRFEGLGRKMVRLVVYTGARRSHEVSKEIIGTRGYASGFQGLVKYIQDLLPPNEVIRGTLREERKLYPEIAVREFVANALVHQDLEIGGASVLIDMFSDRIEITNPGRSLVDPDRFIYTAPRSRNEKMAALLRRMGICEERGKGVGRAIEAIELDQLPAPKFHQADDHVRVTMFAPKPTGRMTREDRVRAIFQHASLLYVNHHEMTNASVRKRFNISDVNYPIASRYIAEAIAAGVIVPTDPENASKRNASYIPIWAR